MRIVVTVRMRYTMNYPQQRQEMKVIFVAKLLQGPVPRPHRTEVPF